MPEEYGDRTIFNIGNLAHYHGPQELRPILSEEEETELCSKNQQGDQDNTLGDPYQNLKLSCESRPFYDLTNKLKSLSDQSKSPCDSHQGSRPNLLVSYYNEGMQQSLE